MKVLFLESYFKPEKTSGAHLAQDTRDGLCERGHTMLIFAPTPSRGVRDEVRREYKKRKHETESDGKVEIFRYAMFREGRNPLVRAARYSLIEAALLWKGLTCKKADVLPMGSTPPINGLMTTLIKKVRKIPFVYTVQDLFPESLVSTGMTKKGSLLWKIGSWVSDVTYKNASHIIVISESIKESLIEKGVPEEKISVVYNWIDTEKTVPVSREENTLFDEFGLSRDKFYVTYAGNLGASQNIELVVECAEKMRDNENIMFVIFGEGSEKAKLEKRIEDSKLSNIKMFPMQSVDRVSEVYSLGDASFVICKKGVGGGAFPSKAASIMACATPVIASFDEDSDLCRTVKNANAGLCTQPENASDAVNLIMKLYEDKELCRTLSQNARNTACTKFSKETGVSKRIEIYEKYALKREK